MSVAVSVVIPAYNTSATLGETLRALQAQMAPPSHEIIVVDNASTDDTPLVARSYGVRLLYEPRRGPAAARNCGLRAACGEVVAHLDADTVPTRRWLREISSPFDASGTTIVAGNTVCYQPRTGAELYVAASGLYDTVRAITREVFPFVPSLNLAVRRRAALEIGGWCEEMPTGEDVDFSHRLLERFATKIVYAERAVLYHHTRADDAALRKQAWTYGEGAAELYRRYPGELRFDATRLVHVAWVLGSRTALPYVALCVRAVKVIPDAKLEFYRYHSLWTRNFWGGFLQAYLTGKRRQWAA
jgi:glycosyltransferase involved in cell wall biosynthesis